MAFHQEHFKEDFGNAMEAYQEGIKKGQPLGHLELNFYSALVNSGYAHEGQAFRSIPEILPQIEKQRGEPFQHLPQDLPGAMKRFAGESSPEYTTLLDMYQTRGQDQGLNHTAKPGIQIMDHPVETIGGQKGAKSLEELAGRGAAIAGSGPTGTPSSTPKGDDAIHAELSKNNAKFDMFAARMESFNGHPAIREALDRAQKYGFDPQKAIHESLDKNPVLKESFLKIHKMFHEHIQPLMDRHMAQIDQLQDPEMRKQAQHSLYARMGRMDDAQNPWPDRHTVLDEKPENASRSVPSLGAVIGHLLNKLKELIFGRSAAASPSAPSADTANRSENAIMRNPETQNGPRPSMRRRP